MTDEQDDLPVSRPDDPAMDAICRAARVDRWPAATKTMKPLDEDTREAVVSNIRAFQEHHQVSTTALARWAGVSSSMLSETLAGKYRGDIDRVLRASERAIGEWLRRQDAPIDPMFVETRIAKDVFAIVRTTSKLQGIGVFYGSSGIGKSMALQAVRRLDFPSAILVEVNRGAASPRMFCAAVLAQLHRPPAYTPEAFNTIVMQIRSSGRLIIVDEADILQLSTLGLLRELHDATRCPVVLAGRPMLAKKIDATTRRQDIGGSLRGRIIIERNLEARGRGGSGGDHIWLWSVDEVAEILSKWKVRFTGDAAEWLCSLANLSTVDGPRECGGLRHAIKVFTLAVLINPGQEITVERLRQAQAIARDPEHASVLLSEVEVMLKQMRRIA